MYVPYNIFYHIIGYWISYICVLHLLMIVLIGNSIPEETGEGQKEP